MEMIRIQEHEQRIAAVCHALGNPLRVGIVHYIARHPGCICNDIVLRTNRAQSTISGHLRILIDAGLLHCEAEGQATAYWIAPNALSLLHEGLERLGGEKAKLR